ncbi:hypothetical protein AAFF_G00108650 [Aldrovandia affinis]|uniref:Uncharacterized protein n=1 Tax=Aldrovandia affinis TaxID=143900 RepID=A0AAD7WAT9_9TELE|nr:hypothetical protein AAFF_G00108650 [Aldrovandia affinis]
MEYIGIPVPKARKPFISSIFIALKATFLIVSAMVSALKEHRSALSRRPPPARALALTDEPQFIAKLCGESSSLLVSRRVETASVTNE